MITEGSREDFVNSLFVNCVKQRLWTFRLTRSTCAVGACLGRVCVGTPSGTLRAVNPLCAIHRRQEMPFKMAVTCNYGLLSGSFLFIINAPIINGRPGRACHIKSPTVLIHASDTHAACSTQFGRVSLGLAAALVCPGNRSLPPPRRHSGALMKYSRAEILSLGAEVAICVFIFAALGAVNNAAASAASDSGR